jgi:Arm DNA-binding domain
MSDNSQAKLAGPRRTNGLTAVFMRQKKTAGRYGDGNGLYLVVDPSGAQRWVLRVMHEGRRRDIGLGSASLVTLAEARDKALELRRLAKSGQDPVAARRALREGVPNFEDCAKQVHKTHKATWRSEKHQAQWLKTLELYAFPMIGQMAINRIGTAEVLKLLLPVEILRYAPVRACFRAYDFHTRNQSGQHSIQMTRRLPPGGGGQRASGIRLNKVNLRGENAGLDNFGTQSIQLRASFGIEQDR